MENVHTVTSSTQRRQDAAQDVPIANTLLSQHADIAYHNQTIAPGLPIQPHTAGNTLLDQHADLAWANASIFADLTPVHTSNQSSAATGTAAETFHRTSPRPNIVANVLLDAVIDISGAVAMASAVQAVSQTVSMATSSPSVAPPPPPPEFAGRIEATIIHDGYDLASGANQITFDAKGNAQDLDLGYAFFSPGRSTHAVDIGAAEDLLNPSVSGSRPLLQLLHRTMGNARGTTYRLRNTATGQVVDHVMQQPISIGYGKNSYLNSAMFAKGPLRELAMKISKI